MGVQSERVRLRAFRVNDAGPPIRVGAERPLSLRYRLAAVNQSEQRAAPRSTRMTERADEKLSRQSRRDNDAGSWRSAEGAGDGAGAQRSLSIWTGTPRPDVGT